MMSLFIRFCILKNKKCSIFFTCCTHQSRIRKQGFCPGKIGWLIYADFLNQSSEYTFFFVRCVVVSYPHKHGVYLRKGVATVL